MTDTTVKEMLVRVEGRLNTLEEKITGLLNLASAEQVELRKDVDDHEARLRRVEARQWTWGGGIAVGAVVLSVGVSFLVKVL